MDSDIAVQLLLEALLAPLVESPQAALQIDSRRFSPGGFRLLRRK
jgi:hypothetical protein